MAQARTFLASFLAMADHWIRISGLAGSLGVGLGAYGAHGLHKIVKDPNLLESWKTAASYQMLHAVMIAVSAIANKRCTIPPRLFTAGICCFSGSIYGLVLLPKPHPLRMLLGPMTPLGGLMLIAAWLSMAFGSRTES
mmetsp:Transcript_35363/g.56363  ORF Transcript_35363/g.56363 Transcript_35363/m.56363 type:complete len:138 (+) Transcript_35363:21-434(+)